MLAEALQQKGMIAGIQRTIGMFQFIPSALGIGPFQTIHASGKLFNGVIAAAVADQLQMKLRVSFPMDPQIFIGFLAEGIDGI